MENYTIQEEVWKEVDGYEKLYRVSNFGNVYSCISGITLKPVSLKKGYQVVKLFRHKKGRTHYIHRLVATNFIDNPNSLKEVNHKDENKRNNKVDNLEWMTTKQNSNYGSRNKKLSKAVIAENILTGEKIIFESMHDAERLGFDNSNIAKCCKGKLKKHKGYKWSYLEEAD